MSQGQKRDGLWAKALVDSKGSEQKAKALYVRYRVQSIRDELELSDALREQANELAKETIETNPEQSIETEEEMYKDWLRRHHFYDKANWNYYEAMYRHQFEKWLKEKQK